MILIPLHLYIIYILMCCQILTVCTPCKQAQRNEHASYQLLHLEKMLQMSAEGEENGEELHSANNVTDNTVSSNS